MISIDGYRQDNENRLNRFIQLVTKAGISPIILCNKTDLVADLPTAVAQLKSVISPYELLLIQAKFNQGIDEEDPHPDDYILTNWMAYEALKDSEYKDEASEFGGAPAMASGEASEDAVGIDRFKRFLGKSSSDASLLVKKWDQLLRVWNNFI